MAEKLLKVSEVAVIFTVERQTVYKWIKRGWLASIRIGRTLRVSTKAVEDASAHAWIESNPGQQAGLSAVKKFRET